MSYLIMRRYKKDPYMNKIIKKVDTLKEAQEHCNDEETSSATCQDEENIEHTEKYGQWFDSYEQE